MSKASFESPLLSALRRRCWIALATFTSVVSASAFYLFITPSQYKTSAKLIVGKQEVSISNLGQELTDRNTKTPGKTADPIATQAELVKSQKVLQRALQNLQRKKEISSEELPTLRQLRKEIDVEIVPATNILRLVYQTLDPEVAAQIINAVAKSAVAESLEENHVKASVVKEFLEAKITEQQVRLQQVETAESEYRQNHGLVNIEAQTKSWVSSLTELKNEERQLLAQLQETITRDEFLQQATGIDTPTKAYTTIRINQDEELKELRSKLTELETVISTQRSRLTDQEPRLLALLEERDYLQTLYQQKLSATLTKNKTLSPEGLESKSFSRDLISTYVSDQIKRKALESRLKNVQAELNNFQTLVTQLPIHQQSLARLIRQREEVEMSLQLLQNKLEEARIAEAQPISNTRIVSLAEINTIPASPKPAVILVIGTVAGIFLAMGIVLLMEIIDLKLHDVAEAEDILELPILGVLPKIPAPLLNASMLEQFLDNPLLVEPYRALLKTIESSTSQKTPVIVVSSAIAGEGKSAVVVYLSAVAAMLSRRTLIIDADLLQAQQHLLLDLPDFPGLTEVVANPSTFLSVVRSTAIKNLSVLTHGKWNSRPSALIEAESMNIILEKAAEHYDLVIIESSVASICADAATLSQVTDGLVLVVRPNFVSKGVILQTISALQKNSASLLGIVINETAMPEEERYFASLYNSGEQRLLKLESEKKRGR